jgi:ElaB/YqjD/DUF883 family membrane-anchored ribosome-binding protein
MSVSPTDVTEGRANDDIGTKLESFSAQVEANVERGRNAVAEWKAAVTDKTTKAAKRIDGYTHEHPWRMVCSALTLGWVMGMMFGCQASSRRARF